MSQPPKQIVFKLKEIAEILVKEKSVHEGHWGIFVRFGLSAMNIKDATEGMFPAALVPLMELGIQRFEEPNGLTIDAAIVNPIK